MSFSHQHLHPYNPHLSKEDTTILKEEIESLLQKQTICKIPTATEGFFFNMFIAPKKDEGQRPVINSLEAKMTGWSKWTSRMPSSWSQ